MKQKISECMDGELDAQSAARLLRELADSAEHRAEWTVYHMIGDAMRGKHGRFLRKTVPETPSKFR